MAKKQKFAEGTENAPVQSTQPIDVPVAEGNATEAAASQGNPQFTKKPGLFLSCDGVDYRFDRRAQLPKKAAVVGNIFVDNQEVPFQVTSNKGWTPEDKVIEYIWLALPPKEDGEVVKGFITLDYLVPAISFVGKDFGLNEGEAARKNPDRIPKNIEGEALRKQKAAETIAKKKAEKEAAEAAAKEGQPTEGEPTQPEAEAQAS